MIVLTGATGFIGSVILGYLNKNGRDDIIIVDDINSEHKFYNIKNKKFYQLLSTNDEINYLGNVETVIHFGADSNTLNKDWNSVYKQNVQSTRNWYNYSLRKNAKFIFASSAAIYGNGSGPTNYYAFSKLCSEKEIEGACILRLFNVYGPNEYHKERMASTFYQWHRQSSQHKTIQLFSGSENYSRDFIYVEDVAKIVFHFLKNFSPGTYDVGTGQSTNFLKLAELFSKQENSTIQEIPMPEDLKTQYQIYSQASVQEIVNTRFNIQSLLSVDDGMLKYLEYLKCSSRY